MPQPPHTNELGQPIGPPLPDWTPARCPERAILEGRVVRLEPLAARHAASLVDAFSDDREGRMWTYLPYGPFADEKAFHSFLAETAGKDDPLFFAIVLRDPDRALGFAALQRIDPRVGSIEIGHVAYAPRLARSRAATEAQFLFMKRVFELGYRRYEWKCDSLNEASNRAALRLGFTYEGTFRNATVYRGRSRDTAWYSVTDDEWPRIRDAFEAWLSDENFDEKGNQRAALTARVRF